MLNEFVEGKYELMGGNYYIPALEKYYAYPNYNMGYSRSLLLARSDDRSIHSYDLESMNGKTIGVYENARENISPSQRVLWLSTDCIVISDITNRKIWWGKSGYIPIWLKVRSICY